MAHFTTFAPVDNSRLRIVDHTSPPDGWQFIAQSESSVDFVRNLTGETFRLDGVLDMRFNNTLMDFDAMEGGLLQSVEYLRHPEAPGAADFAMWTITGLGLMDASVFVDAATRGRLAVATALFQGNDTVDGSDGADRLYGFGGNDHVFGGAGADFLDGGTGKDTLEGFSGADVYTVSLRTDGRLQDQVVENPLHADADTLRLTGTWTGPSLRIAAPVAVENIDARGTGASLLDLVGTTASNTLIGNSSRNLLEGGAGNDILSGEQGADVLRGGLGRDKLFGGVGRDTLTGGEAADLFAFAGVLDLSSSLAATDTITDFSGAAGDRIGLAGIDADAALAGDQAFTFIGSAAFRGGQATGKLRYTFDSSTGTGVLQGSTDADALAEFVIRLQGVPTLTAGDLVL